MKKKISAQGLLKTRNAFFRASENVLLAGFAGFTVAGFGASLGCVAAAKAANKAYHKREEEEENEAAEKAE